MPTWVGYEGGWVFLVWFQGLNTVALQDIVGFAKYLCTGQSSRHFLVALPPPCLCSQPSVPVFQHLIPSALAHWAKH